MFAYLPMCCAQLSGYGLTRWHRLGLEDTQSMGDYSAE